WFSKASTSEYPIKWNLHVTDLNLKLEITAVTPDSEFFPESQSVSPYWEGSTLINGNYDDIPVSGYGFMELVGY
ncbi:MAG: lipocalin family protein, partial [SAR202 cluster bacterium]|nr:lipocalin family protein [SAR202 cluster bacterium]